MVQLYYLVVIGLIGGLMEGAEVDAQAVARNVWKCAIVRKGLSRRKKEIRKGFCAAFRVFVRRRR